MAGNTVSNGNGPDIDFAVTTDGGGNVVGITDGSTGLTNRSDHTGTAAAPLNPLLAPLGNYGATVQTLALLPNSPAIDIANCPATLTVDARGIGRPQGTNCDAGAFESRGFTAGTRTGNGQATAVNATFTAPVGLIVTGTMGEPVVGGQVAFTITPGMGGASATFRPAAGCTARGGTVAVCTIGNGGGVSSPTFAANSMAGSFTIVATASGILTPIILPETNAVPLALGPTHVAVPTSSAGIPMPLVAPHSTAPAMGATPLPQPERH